MHLFDSEIPRGKQLGLSAHLGSTKAWALTAQVTEITVASIVAASAVK